MQRYLNWFLRGAEGIAAAMLAAMFATFLVQIFARYVLQTPFGWTLELCLTLWVWIVFFGNAFVVRDRDHVTFDILYLAVPRRVRQAMALISAAAIAIGMIWALAPTWDYIDWLKIRKSATMKIPLRTIFSIYAVFMVVVALRYIWRFVEIARTGPPDEDHALVPGEEQ